MRIFVGLCEIANTVATYADGFRALGHETWTVVWSKNPFYPDSQYDVVLEETLGAFRPGAGMLEKGLRWIRRTGVVLGQFLRALVKCDVFVFIFGTSFFRRYWDYPILKLFGKTVISVFCGDDIRYWYAYEREIHSLGLDNELKPYFEYREYPDDLFLVKIRTIRAAERYADLILSQPTMGQLQIRPYMRFNIPLNLAHYRFNVSERLVPLVVHAPSDRGVKGTESVLAAVEQLRQEGLRFEFRLIENMPNSQLRELLVEADIVVDQLYGQTVATLALESLATGNVTLARYLPEYAHVPPDCPVVNVTTVTLVEKLREVILDLDLRRQLAHAGRKYVEEFHDHVRVAQQILNWSEPGGIRQYDFIPTFFRDEFVMPPELLRKEREMMREQRRQRLASLLFSRASHADE